jgi:ABC-2 type transport system permease protein
MHKLAVVPSTYVIFAIFSLAIGAIFAFLMHSYVRFEQDVPFIQMFFRCFWLPACVVVPLISMRSFSEEYKNGTFQSLFSTTVSHTEVILAKFSALYLVFAFLWLCSLFVVAAAGVGEGSLVGEVAFAARFNVAGGLSFIFLIGTFFISVGMLASSLTENQVVSSMVTFFILMVSFIGGQFSADNSKISNLNLLGSYREAINIFAQLDNFCNGVVDSRVIVFYLSLSALTLCLCAVAVQKKLG